MMPNALFQTPCLLHRGQVFLQYGLVNFYKAEEIDFKNHVKNIFISDASLNAKIISACIVY